MTTLRHPISCTRFSWPFIKYFNSIVEQVSQKQGKVVGPIHIVGGETKIDAERFEPLISSFVHVFRNIVDHGLESPDERLDHGKSEEGQMSVHIDELTNGGSKSLQIKVLDDGRGIDTEKIKEKVSSTMPNTDFNGKSDHEIAQFVFHPGVSSKDQAGEFSGRGVGMDAVKSEVLKLGGKVEIFTEKNKGTELHISVPLDGIECPVLKSA